MERGKFIVFEGGEGSGKSSHVRLTAEFLTQHGIKVLQTHEPGGTALGKIVRRLILDHTEEANGEPLAARAELLLFLADRAQHVAEQILPALQRGETVLCDRFTGSTLAYQVGARGLQPENFIQEMEAFARNNLEPDVTVYLDMDPAIGINRKQTQADHTMNTFDDFGLEFHQDVHHYFKQYANGKPNWKVFDASRTLTTVQYDINQLLTKLYGFAS